MKCLNCGFELIGNVKFCSNCGVEINLQVALTEENVMTELPKNNNSNRVTIQKEIPVRTTKKQGKQLEIKLKKKARVLWNKLNLYGKFSTIAVAIFTILSLVAFFAGKTFSGVIAMLSLAFVIIALLIKKEIIKVTKSWLHIVALVLAIALIVPYFNTFKTNHPTTNADSNTIIDTSIIYDESTKSEITESDNIEDVIKNDITVDYEVDYNDAESFEEALNNGIAVNGKVVRFDVVEYKPDSALGINCWSGEHLNFISEDELNVAKGSIVVGRVTEEPSKTFGSWEIPYEVLSINGEKFESDTTGTVNTEGTSNTQSTEITMIMGEDDFKGMNYKEAEKIFREMGFTSFEYRTVDTEIESAADTICYIEITERFIGDSDFIKGDKFDIDSIVTFFSYKYEAPIVPSPVFYSTNDYETAKKGNTGVFSYKNKSGSYDVYWIINFDEGYVYYFTEGNGESTCDKVKIVSGDLNDRITVTWHDGGDQWSWYLHFKYVNYSETLVVNDHNGVAIEFTTTDLDDALALRNTKKIKEY